MNKKPNSFFKFHWFVFLLIIALGSCKNEETITPDPCDPVIIPNYSYIRIEPSDYLMAWPGS